MVAESTEEFEDGEEDEQDPIKVYENSDIMVDVDEAGETILRVSSYWTNGDNTRTTETIDTMTLSSEQFASLARSVAKNKHIIAEIFEPPFVVVFWGTYDTDVEQQTPELVEAWAFSELRYARDMEARLQDDIAVMPADEQWRFKVAVPSIPEELVEDIDELPFEDEVSHCPESIMAQYHAIIAEHFLDLPEVQSIELLQSLAEEDDTVKYWHDVASRNGMPYLETVRNMIENAD